MNTISNRYFESRFCPDAKRVAVWQVICDYLQPFIAPESCVLDLGAGYCSFINHVRARERHALDLFPSLGEYAHADVQTHVGSCDNLTIFSVHYFDVVLASNLLEHLTREAVANTLSEVRRVLKPSGRFIVIQPNFRYCFREYFDDYTHLLVFTDVTLVDLLSASGFHVERVEPRFLPTSMKSRLPKWPWMVRLYLKSPLRPFAGQMLVICRPSNPGR